MFDDQKKVKARSSEGAHKKKTLLMRCFLGKVFMPRTGTATGEMKSATRPVRILVIVLDNDSSWTCCAVMLDKEAGNRALDGRASTIVPMLEITISAYQLGFQRGVLWT